MTDVADKPATVTAGYGSIDMISARLEADVTAARMSVRHQDSRRRYLQRATMHAERAQGLISDERRHISDADSRRAGVHAQLARFWLARSQIED